MSILDLGKSPNSERIITGRGSNTEIWNVACLKEIARTSFEQSKGSEAIWIFPPEPS